MGIINVTPDSFSSDGLAQADGEVVEQAIAQARRFEDEGADCLDVGGHSTRPGHDLLPVAEETACVVPVISIRFNQNFRLYENMILSYPAASAFDKLRRRLAGSATGPGAG